MTYRVGAFVRVSTDRLEQQSSLENQKELVEDYIREKGWKLEKLYTGPESGTKMNKSMKELLNDIEEKKIDILLVKDLFRLARNAELSHRVKNLADEKGVYIITLNNLVNTMEGKDEWYGLYAMFAQMESENTSQKIKYIFKKKMEKGKYINSTPPYGYRIENQKLHVKKDSTPDTVRRIFNGYLDGKSPDAIAKELTEEGIPTPAQVNNRKNAGLRWHERTVKNILVNRHYIGTVVQGQTTSISITTAKRKQLPDDEQYIVEDVHQPIVSKELFEKVQEAMAKRQHNRTAPQKRLFSNLLYCEDCGTGLWYRGNRKGYVCGKYAKQGTDHCTSHLIKENVLLEIIKSDFHSYTSNVDKQVMKRNLHKKVANYSKKLEEEINKVAGSIEVLKKRKVNLITMMADGELDRESCLAAIEKAKDDTALLEKELEKLQTSQEQNNIDLSDLEKDFVDFLFSGSTAIEIVHRVIDRIEVKEDGTPKIFYSFNEPEMNNAS